MENNFKIVVTVASGIEAVTKRELNNLGYFNLKAIDGKIELTGNYADIAKLNLNLRTGERVLIKLATFNVPDFNTFYENVKKINFEDFLLPSHKILIDGNCLNSTLMAIKKTGGVCKKAIIDRLTNFYNSPITEDGNRAIVVFTIKNDIATIYLDSSGDGLHKRGYRDLTYKAPLKETIAAALVLLSVYNKNKHLADVFCGGGTIAIEAALIAKNIAPGLYRNFDFEHYKNFSKRILDLAKSEAKSKILHDFKPQIFACDINPEMIKIAKHHATLAKVENVIQFKTLDMANFSSDLNYGVIISNPPYGNRIGSKSDQPSLYKNFFDMFNKLNNWSAYLLTDYLSVEKYAPKQADKKRKLYNANIECVYYSFMGQKPPKTSNFAN